MCGSSCRLSVGYPLSAAACTASIVVFCIDFLISGAAGAKRKRRRNSAVKKKGVGSHRPREPPSGQSNRYTRKRKSYLSGYFQSSLFSLLMVNCCVIAGQPSLLYCVSSVNKYLIATYNNVLFIFTFSAFFLIKIRVSCSALLIVYKLLTAVQKLRVCKH